MDQPPECDDMYQRIASLLPFLLGASGLQADDAKFEVEKHRNLSYNLAKTADPVKHQLDLYVPKGAKNFPVMVFVHGGTWKSGNKELYAPLGETFAKHPDHIQDVAKAVAWVKNNCGKYGGDKEHLFLSGHSAGGHLVALLALDESYLKAEGCSSRDICGVTAVSGVYTITPWAFGDIFGKDDEVCKAASPINHVKGHHPPFLIAYGTKDFPFMDLMAEDLGKKLKQAKCDATVMKLERDHFSIIIEMGMKSSDELNQAMVKFMTHK